MKKVSILILTYNRLELSQKYIPGVVESIGKIDNEVLIWDNGSTDGTFDWLCEYSRADSRVSYIYGNDTNIGVEAVNKLAECASGEYLLKIDDDVIAPPAFAERLVNVYEEVNEPRLLFLAWDMHWSGKTFATRSGTKMYRSPEGRTHKSRRGGEVLINYFPERWMVNGVCRLCKRDKFLEIGGHPQGVIYGVDSAVSKKAAKHGYWIGFYHTYDYVEHKGTVDSNEYRALKNKELERTGSPLHV